MIQKNDIILFRHWSKSFQLITPSFIRIVEDTKNTLPVTFAESQLKLKLNI